MYILLAYERELSKNDYLKTLILTIIKNNNNNNNNNNNKCINDKSESYSTQTISCSFNLTFSFFSLSQALLAAEATTVHCPKTMGWLVSRQKPDGSFTNLLGTMYVLPSLIGALPYDLQHIPCPKNTTGKRYDVQYIPCSESSVGNRMRFHS